MSCHDIGHGINAVMEVVVDLYNKGEISADAVRRLGHEAQHAVNWCDGNPGEAVEVFLGRICGQCLKPVEDESDLYSVYRTSLDDRIMDQIADNADAPTASFEYCRECFDLLVAQATGDPEAGPRERQRIDTRRQK